jgi:hypothetical protein
MIRPCACLVAATFALLAMSCASAGGGGTFTNGGDDDPAPAGEEVTASFDDGAGLDDFDVVLGDWGTAEGTVRQSGTFADPEYPRMIRKNLVFTDVDLSVRCRMESGRIDQACGAMFHVQDSDNYLLTRANALEGNVRLYHVVDGTRSQTATLDMDVVAAEWHELAVSTHGASITVSWDGAEVLTAEDDSFTTGHVGLWTKADSVTSFDDLIVAERGR